MKEQRVLILEPRDLWWERNGLSDPTVAEFSGRTYMLYRAVGEDHLARLGLAVAEDGEHFERFGAPLLEGDELSVYERLGFTSPRLTKIDRNWVLAYASLSVYPSNDPKKLAENQAPWRSRISIIQTRDFRQFERLGVVMKDLDSHDPVLLPVKIQNNYWLMHRLDKGIHVSVSPNIRTWGGGYQLLEPVESWESGGIAASSVPIETAQGWLLFYNVIDTHQVGRVGAVLLNQQNPAFVIARTKTPIFEANEPWEKRAREARGVRLAGVLKRDNEAYLYYGAGGTVIGLGKISVNAVLQSLGLPAT